MKTLKHTPLLFTLIIIIVSCDDIKSKNNLGALEDQDIFNSIQSSSIYTFESKGFNQIEMNLSKEFLMDTTNTYKGTSYHYFNLDEGTTSLIMFNQTQGLWQTVNLQMKNENKKLEIKNGVLNKFKLSDMVFDEISIKQDGNIAYFLKSDIVIDYNNVRRVNDSVLSNLKFDKEFNLNTTESNYSNEETLEEDFEYSDKWRKEAYMAAKEFVVFEVKKSPNCRVTRQGLYQPELVKYIGGQGYSVKTYCEFDCNQNYNNPSFFFVEMYYEGNNTWRGRFIEQKFVD